jgi:hypothetical protein
LNKQDLRWELLFGDEFEEYPDPNKPENSSKINAKTEKYKAAIKLFYNSGGDEFFKDKARNIKLKIMTCVLLDRTEEENIGKSCRMLDDIRRDLNFLCQMEAVIGERRDFV